MKRYLLISLFSIIFLAACQPDPRREAQAYQITSQTDQQAANNEQARRQSQDLHNIEIQNKEATQATWQKTEMIFRWASITAMSLAVIALAISLSIGLLGVGVATKNYAIQRAQISANLIYLDKLTRQFPQLVSNIGGGKFTISNLNLDSTRLLDQHQDADRQLIAGSSATQLAGAIAQEARQSSDPAGLGMMRPAIIDANTKHLQIGEDVFSRMIPLPEGDG